MKLSVQIMPAESWLIRIILAIFALSLILEKYYSFIYIVNTKLSKWLNLSIKYANFKWQRDRLPIFQITYLTTHFFLAHTYLLSDCTIRHEIYTRIYSHVIFIVFPIYAIVKVDVYSWDVIYFLTFETSSTHSHSRRRRKIRGLRSRVSPKNVSLFFCGRGPLTRSERSFFFSRYTQSSLFL